MTTVKTWLLAGVAFAVTLVGVFLALPRRRRQSKAITPVLASEAKQHQVAMEIEADVVFEARVEIEEAQVEAAAVVAVTDPDVRSDALSQLARRR